MILAATLNRLLGHSPEAAADLAQWAGRSVRIETPLSGATLVVTDDGKLGKSGATPEATITLPLSFFIVRTHNPVAAARQIELAGNAELGHLIGQVLARLRWDAAEELSSLVGDVVAHRLVKFAGLIGGVPGALGGRLLSSYAEYWRDEDPLLPKAAQVERWHNEVDALRDDLVRLEQRIQRLE